jgi:sodium-dependent phosphate cotransporter
MSVKALWKRILRSVLREEGTALDQIARRVQEESNTKTLLRFLLVLALLYIFLLAITLMGASFKLFGKGFADALFQYTSSPIAGLFIGILATSIVQSSSTVTSTTVTMVAAGTLDVTNACFIVMGANVGTSVTNTLVAMGFFRRRSEFGRAVAGSTVHDFFNLVVTAIFFPLEWAFGLLDKIANYAAEGFMSFGQVTFTSPIKTIVGPPAHFVVGLLTDTFKLDGKVAAVLALVIAAALLFLALKYLTGTMKKLLMGRLANIFDRTLKRGGLVGILVGAIATAIVQSSSVTTSLLVPLVASGLIDVAQAFPLTLGANIGTTVTAVLASFTGNVSGVVVAFEHVLFNVIGVVAVYPFPPLRKIPISLAERLGKVAERSRKVAIMYVVCTFYVIPVVVILLSRLLS